MLHGVLFSYPAVTVTVTVTAFVKLLVYTRYCLEPCRNNQSSFGIWRPFPISRRPGECSTWATELEPVV